MTDDLRRPCRKCHGNGFLTNLAAEGTAVEVCDECQGVKFMIPAPEIRTLLGTCIHCSQEIHLTAATPCPKADNHIVPGGDFIVDPPKVP